MASTPERSATERLTQVRDHLLAAGLTVGLVEAATATRPAQLAYGFQPQQVDLAVVAESLDRVQLSKKTWVLEAPHAWHSTAPQYPGRGVPQDQWPDRAGQFSTARLEIANADQRAPGRAERLRRELSQYGAVLDPLQTDNQGHLTFTLRYHTLTPAIADIDSILLRAREAPGIRLHESKQQERARFDGIMTVAEKDRGLSIG